MYWIKLLVEAGPSMAGHGINELSPFGVTALTVAIDWGCEQAFYALLNLRADVNVCDAPNNTPLVTAIMRGRHKMIGELIKRGASVDRVALLEEALECHGYNYDSYGIGRENSAEETLRFLIKEIGLDINRTVDNKGYTLLTKSVMNGDVCRVFLLIRDYGEVDVNQVDGGGYTALTRIIGGLCGIRPDVLEGSPKFRIMKMLIENGADINRPDENGLTPLQLAKSRNEYEKLNKLIRYLEEFGARDILEGEASAGDIVEVDGVVPGADDAKERTSCSALDDSDDKASSDATALKSQEVSELNILIESDRSKFDPTEQLKQFLMKEGLSKEDAEEILEIEHPLSDEGIDMKSDTKFTEMVIGDEDDLLAFLPGIRNTPLDEEIIVNVEEETGRSLLWGGMSDLAIGGVSFAAVLAVSVALGAKGNVEGLLEAGVAEELVG